MDIKRARIVVVEDEKIMSTFILSSLRKLGILDLYAFEDGATAIREVIKLKPDLILTDVHMQPVGGIELVRQLRSLRPWPWGLPGRPLGWLMPRRL